MQDFPTHAKKVLAASISVVTGAHSFAAWEDRAVLGTER